MKPVDSMPYSLGSPIIPFLSRIYPIPHIDTYSFKIHSSIVLSSMPKLPVGFLLKF